MWNKLKALLEFSSKNGTYLPMAYDGATGKPSVTLFFSYVSFLINIVAIVYLFCKPDNVSPAIASLMLFVICVVLYRIRNLDKVKFDLQNKSIELDGEDEKV